MDYANPNVDYADLLRLPQNGSKPAIARGGGVCMAGGMGLLCMTDMAVAADHGMPPIEFDAKADWLIGRIVDKSPTPIRRGNTPCAPLPGSSD